jgi:hypothetical protein
MNAKTIFALLFFTWLFSGCGDDSPQPLALQPTTPETVGNFLEINKAKLDQLRSNCAALSTDANRAGNLKVFEAHILTSQLKYEDCCNDWRESNKACSDFTLFVLAEVSFSSDCNDWNRYEY